VTQDAPATSAAQSAAQCAIQAVDIRGLVQDHPWLAVGGSIALGFLAAELLSASSRSAGGEAKGGKPLGELTSWLGEQLGGAKGFAAGSVMNYVHSLLARGLDAVEEGLKQGGPGESRDSARPQQPTEPVQQGAHS